jgi:hypothetical protein
MQFERQLEEGFTRILFSSEQSYKGGLDFRKKVLLRKKQIWSLKAKIINLKLKLWQPF